MPGDVDRSAADVAGQVSYQGHIRLGQRVVLRADNGVVRGVVQVAGARSDRHLAGPGHAHVACLLVVPGSHRIAEALRLLHRVVGPGAGQQVVGAALVPAQEVERSHGELQAGAALQEHDLVVLGYIEQAGQALYGPSDHPFELLGAVADLHDPCAHAHELGQGLLELLDHREGKGGRAGREVVHA